MADAPAQVLQLFHEAVRTELLARSAAGAPPRRDVFVRTIKLPISDAIGDLRQSHLNALVLVAGVVTHVGPVLSLVQSVKYDCLHCGFVVGPLLQRAEAARARRPRARSGGPFSEAAEGALYRRFQQLTLEERPGSVPAGRLPRSKAVALLHDLIDCAAPGDNVEVTGVYFHTALDTAAGFPLFDTMMEANHVRRLGGPQP